MIRGWYSTVSWVRLLNHSVAMASSGSSGSAISYCSSAMPAAFAARSSTSRLYESATSSSMHQCSTLPSNHGCSTSSRCSPQTLQFSLDQHIPPCGPLSSPNHSSKRDKQRSRGLSSSSTCGHGLQQPALLQPSRCTWPAFASLTANSQLGKLLGYLVLCLQGIGCCQGPHLDHSSSLLLHIPRKLLGLIQAC